MPSRSEKQRVEKDCLICGVRILVIPSRADRKKYCSVQCRRVAQANQLRGRIVGPRTIATDPRQCRICSEWKPLADYYVSDRGAGRTAYVFRYCKACATVRARQYADPERTRRRRYGVSLGDLVDRQGHPFCAVCGTRDASVVDHDHQTGRVRGALCNRCNVALHYLEDEAWVASATAYLKGASHPVAQ